MIYVQAAVSLAYRKNAKLAQTKAQDFVMECQSRTSVLVCSLTPCISVMWLHGSLYGRPFLCISLNFDLDGVITCQTHCVFPRAHCYSCNFPSWKGEKKLSHHPPPPCWRHREANMGKQKKAYREAWEDREKHGGMGEVLTKRVLDISD